MDERTRYVVTHTANITDKVLTFVGIGFLGKQESNPFVLWLINHYGVLLACLIGTVYTWLCIKLLYWKKPTPVRLFMQRLLAVTFLVVVISNVLVLLDLL